jgi:two-component system, OmpR family, sensor histidine kinase MtrB
MSMLLPRLGLRARATVAFASGALLTALVLATITYQVARVRFVESARRAAVSQAQSNGAQVEIGLRNGVSSLDLLKSLTLQDGQRGDIVVLADNEKNCLVGRDPEPVPVPRSAGSGDAGDAAGSGDAVDVPVESCRVRTTLIDFLPQAAERDLRRLVATGKTGWIIDRVDSIPMVVTGVGMHDDFDQLVAGYYERRPLKAEQDNLAWLARALAVAATIATLLGAMFGRVVSSRVMKPLRQVATAAKEIASGRLDTRIDSNSDTDLDALVGSFNEMAESLQQRLEREARFASDVSHELRTPLTSLSAAVQLLGSRRDEMSERSQTALDVLTTQTDYFQQLVLDLLEISRFDAGAAELNMTDFDLVELVKRVIAPFEGVNIDATGLDPIKVHLDKRRIERILANLLQNAMNYGGGAKLITLQSAEGLPEHEVSDVADVRLTRVIQIIVDDDGPGVAEAEREVVFERFRRGAAQRSGATKGTGLGLALVSEHARLHQGSIEVTSSPSGGARFVVVLIEGDVEKQTLDVPSRVAVSS